MEKHRTRSIEFKGTAHPTDQSRLPRVATGVREGDRQPQEGHAADEAKWLDRAPRRRFIATTDSEHDGRLAALRAAIAARRPPPGSSITPTAVRSTLPNYRVLMPLCRDRVQAIHRRLRK
jgi:hypothetical protein